MKQQTAGQEQQTAGQEQQERPIGKPRVLRAIGRKVIVEPVGWKEEVSGGGIFLPENSQKKPTTRGRVLSKGKRCEGDFAVGDMVRFGKLNGTEIRVKGNEAGQSDRLFLILRDDEIDVVEG